MKIKNNKRTYKEIKESVTGKPAERGYLNTNQGKIKLYLSPGIEAMEDDYSNASTRVRRAIMRYVTKDYGTGDMLWGCYPGPLGDTMETGGIMVSYALDGDDAEILYVYLHFEKPPVVME